MPATSTISESRGDAFARLLRAAREAHPGAALTQDQLAEQTGVSRATILRWEGGSATRPDPDHVRAVCNALDIPVAEALIALGYLQESDLGSQGADLGPRRTWATAISEIRQVVRRLEESELAGAL